MMIVLVQTFCQTDLRTARTPREETTQSRRQGTGLKSAACFNFSVMSSTSASMAPNQTGKRPLPLPRKSRD